MTTYESAIMKNNSVLAVVLSVLVGVSQFVLGVWYKVSSRLLDLLGLGLVSGGFWYWNPVAGLIASGVSLLIISAASKR